MKEESMQHCVANNNKQCNKKHNKNNKNYCKKTDGNVILIGLSTMSRANINEFNCCCRVLP